MSSVATVRPATLIGVDLVDLTQLSQMLEGDSLFAEYCWTPVEFAQCNGSVERLGARWAAKEAVMKALGHGIGDIDPTDIEVSGRDGERPEVRLSGSAEKIAKECGVLHWQVSMSHDRGMAIAFVLAEVQAASPHHSAREKGRDE